MESGNICKFNFNRSSDLICANFIYETQNTQAQPRLAERHGICLAAEGEGIFSTGRTQHRITPGTLFFPLEGERFSIQAQPQLHYYYINFHGRRGDEYMQRLGISPENCVFQGYQDLIPFWQECCAMAEEGSIDILCEAVLLYSLAKLKPAKKQQNDIVQRMTLLTQEHFADPNLSIAAIAEEFGYNPKYLSSLFKKEKGIPYTQYLQELRIRHAVFLMEEGVVSVKNVALLSGFRDALYFSKVFTKTEGISPKAYILDAASRRGS